MGIYSLQEAYDQIFSKLADMTPKKQQRYQTVYHKLSDFEHLLQQRGVPTDMNVDQLSVVPKTDASLLTASDAMQSLRSYILGGSVRLMRMISTDASFEQILEQAKTEKNRYRIRTYLHLLREYSTYMSTANKKKTLVLLYELLMHPDGDVRRAAGETMGLILANSGPKYRKERPDTAAENAIWTNRWSCGPIISTCACSPISKTRPSIPCVSPIRSKRSPAVCFPPAMTGMQAV